MGAAAAPRQRGLRQHTLHDAVVDVQVRPRDDAHRPFLGVIEAQDLCLDAGGVTMFGFHPVGYATSRVSPTTAAAQKPLAEEWRAPTTTPVTMRDRSSGPILRDSWSARTLTGEPGANEYIGRRWG